MPEFNSCLCKYTQRRGLILVGCYLWLSALYNITLVEWDHSKTILFLQGESPEYMETEVLSVLLTGLNLACGVQIAFATFGLLQGAFLAKKCLIVAWLWLHSFLLAFYVVYLLAGVSVYSIVGDSSKVILLLYGLVNILISFCAWKMAFDYIRDETFSRGRTQELNLNFEVV
jgi:hypothetical protein